jgi:hypothetical protein
MPNIAFSNQILQDDHINGDDWIDIKEEKLPSTSN